MLITKLSKHFSIKVNPTPHVAANPAVEKIWQEERKHRGHKIFNGKILTCESMNEELLIGHFVEYKYYIAHLRDPSLNLNIKPVSVSGYTEAAGHVLMGKRSQHVTECSNQYELVPAGSIDPASLKKAKIDIRKQIKLELDEETGLKEEIIHKITADYIIYNEGLYEICCKIILDPEAVELDFSENDEHTKMEWVPEQDLEKFVKKNDTIPLSKQLIQLYRES